MTQLARSMRAYGAGDVQAAHALVRVSMVVVDRWSRQAGSGPATMDAHTATLFSEAVERAREELAGVETRLAAEERRGGARLVDGGGE